ncbi:MAG: QsdR family transcriptional regulator [Baekduia sp.]
MAETIRRPVAADALAAAREAFMDGRRIDMGAIAAELGIGRTTLHRWYGTREDLIDGVLCELSSEYFAEARSAARGRGEALVVSVVRSLVTQAVAVESLRDFVVREPEVALRLLVGKERGPRSELERHVRELIAEAMPEDAERAAAAARSVVHVGMSLVWPSLVAGDEPSGDEVVAITRALLAGARAGYL